jgi:hypothetical protein
MNNDEISYNNRVFLIDNDMTEGGEASLWEMNTGEKGLFMGERFDSHVEIVAKSDNPSSISFNNLIINSDSKNTDDLLIRDRCFDTIQVWNHQQNSGVYNLKPANVWGVTKSFDDAFIKFRNGEYRVAIPRDAVKENDKDIFDPTNIDQNDQFAERMKGDYICEKLVFKNDDENISIIVKGISNSGKNNYR